MNHLVTLKTNITQLNQFSSSFKGRIVQKVVTEQSNKLEFAAVVQALHFKVYRKVTNV